MSDKQQTHLYYEKAHKADAMYKIAYNFNGRDADDTFSPIQGTLLLHPACGLVEELPDKSVADVENMELCSKCDQFYSVLHGYASQEIAIDDNGNKSKSSRLDKQHYYFLKDQNMYVDYDENGHIRTLRDSVSFKHVMITTSIGDQRRSAYEVYDGCLENLYNAESHKAGIYVFDIVDGKKRELYHDMFDIFKSPFTEHGWIDASSLDNIARGASLETRWHKSLRENASFDFFKSEVPLYDAIAAQYGLPMISSKNEGQTERYVIPHQAFILFFTKFPAVWDHEMEKAETNAFYAGKRAEKEGLVWTADNAYQMKLDHMSHVMTDVLYMDKTLSHDLGNLKNKDQVEPYLRSVTFGEPFAEAKSLCLNIDSSKSALHPFKGKKLNKTFNIDPYAAANNVYTALVRIGVKSPDDLSLVLDLSKDSERSGDNFLQPVESANQIRLIKLLTKNHDASYSIHELYGNNGNFSLIRDTADMYADVTKKAYIAYDRQAILKEQVSSVMHKVYEQYKASGKDAVYNNASLIEKWHDQTKDVADYIIDKMSYYESCGVEQPLYVTTRNHKPLFNRSLSEIHDEVMNMSNKLNERDTSRKNKIYEWSKSQRDIVNKEIDDYIFCIATSSNDLIQMGQEMNICVGGSTYDRRIRDHEIVIAKMLNKNYDCVACIELSNDCKRIMQFKAPNNKALMEADRVAAANKWIEEAEMVDTHGDTSYFGQDHYFYGRGNFVAATQLLPELHINCTSDVDRLKGICDLIEKDMKLPVNITPRRIPDCSNIAGAETASEMDFA